MEGSVLTPTFEGIKHVKSTDVRGERRLWVPDALREADGDSSNSSKESQKSNDLLTIPVVGNRLAILDYKHEGIVGTPLAHVVSIKINPLIEGCELHGEIRVEDLHGTVDTLFKLKSNQPILVSQSSDNSLMLCQTRRAISPYPFFKVHFDIKDKDSEFLKKSFEFSWNANTDNVHERFDKLLVETITGEHGSATMSYIVHKHAIEGHIVGKFHKSEIANSSIHVDGKIFARYKNVSHSDAMIFGDNAIKMLDDQVFYLSRSILTIPSTYPVEIEVELSDFEGLKVKEKVEFSSWEMNYKIDKEIQVSNGWCLCLTVFGINYAKTSFDQSLAIKDSWRGCGMVVDTDSWTHDSTSEDEWFFGNW